MRTIPTVLIFTGCMACFALGMFAQSGREDTRYERWTVAQEESFADRQLQLDTLRALCDPEATDVVCIVPRKLPDEAIRLRQPDGWTVLIERLAPGDQKAESSFESPQPTEEEPAEDKEGDSQ